MKKQSNKLDTQRSSSTNHSVSTDNVIVPRRMRTNRTFHKRNLHHTTISPLV